MKTIEEVREYGRHLKLPELGINTLVAAWSSPPARRVQSTWRSAVARFASWKMARTIQAESLWVEFLFVFLAEFATEVLGYLDQPFKLKLPHAEKNGKWGAHWYTPDFIVVYSEHVEVVECKTEEELIELSQKKPWLYFKTSDGQWTCPPGEKAVEQYGFRFRVWTPPTNCALVVRNIRMLQDYLRDDCPIVPEDVKAKLLGIISQRPGITLSEILLESDGWRMDHVYILIARGEIYFDLRNQILAELDRAQLYIDEATAVAFDSIRRDLTGAPITTLAEVRLMIGASLVWKTRAYKIANFTEDQVVLTSTDGSIELPRRDFETMARRGEITGLSESSDLEALARAREVVMESGQQELSEAVRKQWVLDHPDSEEYKAVPARTKRHWRRIRRLGTTTFGCGLLGLISKIKLRGNRKPKLDVRLYEIADRIIKEKYMNVTQRSKTAAFGFLKIECERLGLLPPSFPWFIRRIAKIDRYELVNSRSGRKAAYKYSLQIHGRPNPNHGDRPWETALIDHTELDIETRCEATELNLGRPWLSKLQDAFSRRILAFVLAYDAPSYRTLMLLVQKCLRAHGRLPSLLIVDGGKDFGSNYFQTLMARCESTLIVRPPAQSRFGSLIERVFGTTTTQLVHNLSGNTKATKLVRQLTEEVDPQSHAVWSLPELTDLLSTYYRDHYDCKPHPGLDMMTPAAKYAQGMERAGAREHRIIPFTEDVYILTLPTTRSGHARVQAGHGVIINRIAYWSDVMKDPETEGEDLDVRFDPLDVSVAYARVKGRWQKCISAYAAVLQGRTQKEIEIASKIICRRAAAAGKSLSISAMHLAELLASAEVHEELRLQQLQDSAMKKALRTASIVTGMERNLVGGNKQNAGNGDSSKTGETRIAPTATELYPDF